ncbi:essential protein Yae1 [Metarhizium robertsii]|uniref:DUF1715 domain-containing protein n=2 Tax=Metarhizium robertsii TaxID=568076 RepID=E9ERA0_METRA|nr:DUF1715 domain-containing protein [Metarhizium robertsii ARSEF 23]EFZ01913.1 DUF1715 domain-containing protein [Metarhizium robertsii ARSEF 23]EXV02410.1 essential protein Yae1 [Metarhizium robertsii]
MPSTPDPFDDVLNLEDNFYQRGYSQGLADGEKAGRMEGRSFGMQQGFDKFLESGRLASRAIVWANRIPPRAKQSPAEGGGCSDTQEDKKTCALPSLPNNARLEKNVRMVYSLVEPDTLSTENTDEAVQDFDDRVKRAQGKAKVVERMAS